MSAQKGHYALIVLFAINTMNFFDRQILGVVGEQLRHEWTLSDTALGASAGNPEGSTRALHLLPEHRMH